MNIFCIMFVNDYELSNIKSSTVNTQSLKFKIKHEMDMPHLKTDRISLTPSIIKSSWLIRTALFRQRKRKTLKRR
jgi:hypothetical protein